MDKALVFGTKDCRFESCQGHLREVDGERICNNVSWNESGGGWKRRLAARIEKELLQAAQWVHSSVVRAADCRSAGPWFKSGCALLLAERNPVPQEFQGNYKRSICGGAAVAGAFASGIQIEISYDDLNSKRKHAGYSSVGRASDCRVLQLSDGPWFDSGWPDFTTNAE